MSVRSRVIGIAVAAGAALAGCAQKSSLPAGLERVDPSGSVESLRQAAPSFHPLGTSPALLVSDEEYLCFGPGRAVALDGALMSVIYRKSGSKSSLRRCYDDTVRHPPPRWTLLGEHACGARREAYFTIDGRWGARVVDSSAGPGEPHVEVAFVADPDVRADERRAASDGGCHAPP
jgi:hypothetical protein